MTIVYFSIRVDREDLNIETLMNELYGGKNNNGGEQSRPLLLAEVNKSELIHEEEAV